MNNIPILRRKSTKTSKNSLVSLVRPKRRQTYSNAIHLEQEAIESEKRKISMQIRLDKHTKIFASMCPDEILDHYDNYDTKQYYTTLMLGDVSGFTDLTEKYTTSGKGGLSKLTDILNSYLGAMVQEILLHKGDVLKFSGDAFIVMWKLRKGKIMRDLATEAIQTACIIQKKFGSFDSDVGVSLKVKLAIASGKIYFTCIGNPEVMSHYIITGRAVWDVKLAEGLCRGGDILVAPSSWQLVNPNEFVYETLPDGRHILIMACNNSWYHSKIIDSIENKEEDKSEERIISKSDEFILSFFLSRSEQSTRESAVLMNLPIDFLDMDKFIKVDYSLRPKVIKAARAHLKDSLRTYILRPVIRSVEMDEPLEFLTEMRQVVTLFVNATTSHVSAKSLIALVNTTYQIVCNIVDSMKGCVNKTSLFDKDLSFLCVFGLRGDKQELESQIGLKCAAKVRKVLTRIRNISSVTVGVTTGITYCGIVGHILRREYTVIGTPVNKAARLMMAYRNKVICDRETFLHSLLEARHFIFQEPKVLKGITNIGPVYEFNEQSRLAIPVSTWDLFPTLGRKKEIDIFQEMLGKLLLYRKKINEGEEGWRPQYNTLIIKGEPRIGKSRLLDEIFQSIPTGVPCSRVTLGQDDIKSPYNLIQMILALPLGFTMTSTREERENKLLSVLGQINQPHYLCALNLPFQVHFAISQAYQALTQFDKQRVLRKLLLKLMTDCFENIWVVLVDDIENSDYESVQLFDTFTKTDVALFVLSIGPKANGSYRLYNTFLTRAMTVKLKGIDKWYHAGLICQVLGVAGIPIQLEKLIQEKSFGNPGWIESYLNSLVQAGGLEKSRITRNEAEKLGYVMPDISMFKRREIGSELINILDTSRDGWHIYRNSFEIKKNGIEENDVKSNDSATITVYKIPENSALEDINISLSMDAMILRLFDSLSPFDQKLLKSACLLGETINRNMLETLLETTSSTELGLAIAKLFEIRILECAVGDFTKSRGPIAFSRNLRNRSSLMEITCFCIGLIVPKELEDLPKYASCGLMRFKMAILRDTTHRLLTENQKRELHKKAKRYLQQHTRRCLACGEGEFSILLGRKPMKIEKSETSRDSRSELMYTFSQVDFSNCECQSILLTVYPQILDHCRGIGKVDVTLIAILEYIEICLMSYNIPQARKLLTECDMILHQKLKSEQNSSVVLRDLAGEIQVLRGKCYLESGLTNQAEKMLVQALNSLGYSFPTLELVIELKSMIQLEELKLRLTCFRNSKRYAQDNDVSKYSKVLAHCLAHMFELFRRKGMKKHARLAAIWGLNAALKCNNCFFVRCTAFANMLITMHICQNRNLRRRLENESLIFCKENKNLFDFRELSIISDLYSGIFFSRWARGQISEAIQIGFICVRMTNRIGSKLKKTLILPRLIHLLMISCRHSEVVLQLRELEFVSHTEMDKSGRTWYYALSADVQLDTGLKVLSFKNCEEYVQKEGDQIFSFFNPEAERRYYTSMWLWCIRTKQWEASTLWRSEGTSTETVMDEHTVAATITALKELEGLLILYVHKINGKYEDAIVTLKEIKLIFKNLKKMIQIAEIAIPRYMFLKAYYYMIRSRNIAAKLLLRKAKKLCLKVENKMIYQWIVHSERVWSGATSSSLLRDQSVELPLNKLHSEWDEVNANDSIMKPFTFPLPHYLS